MYCKEICMSTNRQNTNINTVKKYVYKYKHIKQKYNYHKCMCAGKQKTNVSTLKKNAYIQQNYLTLTKFCSNQTK